MADQLWLMTRIREEEENGISIVFCIMATSLAINTYVLLVSAFSWIRLLFVRQLVRSERPFHLPEKEFVFVVSFAKCLISIKK